MGEMGKVEQGPTTQSEQKRICGIIMPISAMNDLSESHWAEVLDIFMDVIEDSGFDGNLVSNADDVGVIQKRIIQNIYENPIVICDVSCKNSNVMFELGLRLAFDKPVVIVKDDKTSYSFDTSPIEHLEYPRDLRFGKMVDFKEKLKEKILKTYEVSQTDKNYSPFLKHFGEFKVAKVETKEVPREEIILDELRNLRSLVLRRNQPQRGIPMEFIDNENFRKENKLDICIRRKNKIDFGEIEKKVKNLYDSLPISIRNSEDNHGHLKITNAENVNEKIIVNAIIEAAPGCKLRIRKW